MCLSLARNTQAPFKVRITPNHPVKYKLPFRDLPDLNICIPSKLSPSLRFGLGFPRWTEPLYNYQTHHNRLTVVDKRSSNSVHVRGKRTTLTTIRLHESKISPLSNDTPYLFLSLTHLLAPSEHYSTRNNSEKGSILCS